LAVPGHKDLTDWADQSDLWRRAVTVRRSHALEYTNEVGNRWSDSHNPWIRDRGTSNAPGGGASVAAMALRYAIQLLRTKWCTMGEEPNVVERAIREFVDGHLTSDQLSDELRNCAERPELGLRTFRRARIDWGQFPQDCQFQVFQTVNALIDPILKRFFSGQVSAAEAATQVAPYFLLWGAFGIQPPADANAAWFGRRTELMQKIAEAVTPT
jgi:hypothetical protein